ncbi:MAG: hypothetical protein HQK49_21600 [Oligoflexia bacterium]|nr:hypothetical protein [Oligoflexia bacterium]
MKKNIKVFTLTLLSLSIILVYFTNFICTYANEEVKKSSILWSGTMDVGKGYSSTFLPTNKGFLTEELYSAEPDKHLEKDTPLLLKINKNKMSLANSLDLARTHVLKTPVGEHLYDFYKEDFLDPEAEPWNGMCHRWSAASCDPKVKNYLSVISEKDFKHKNIICGGILLELPELRELFTANYPSWNDNFFRGTNRNTPNEYYNDAYYYKNDYAVDFIEKHGGMNAFKEVNETDFSILDSLGQFYLPKGKFLLSEKWMMPPHLFHDWAVTGLKRGGFIINNDPGDELWNQPVFKMISTATDIKNSGLELPYFRYENDDAVEGNHFFYKGDNKEAEKELDRLDNIDKLLKVLVNDRRKAPDMKISEVIKDLENRVKADIKENENVENKEGNKKRNITLNLIPMAIDSEVVQFVKKQESEGKQLVETIKALLKWKNDTFENAKKLGLKLKDNFIMEKVDTVLDFMQENDNFRAFEDDMEQAKYSYFVIKNKTNDFIYSNWISPNVKNSRPGSIWYARRESDTCKEFSIKTADKFKKILAKKEYVFNDYEDITEARKEFARLNDVREVCIQRATSDLLDLCSSCKSIETLNDELMQIANALEKNTKEGKTPEEEQKLAKEKISNFKKNSNAIIDRDNFNIELNKRGIKAHIDENGDLVF